MNQRSAAFEIRDVVKDFAVGLRGLRLRALDHLSLRVEPGQVFGLLGPNGSGKSTALKLLLGLLQPNAGACSIFGISSQLTQARNDVGYLPESPCFHGHLTGRELVSFHGHLSGVAGHELAGRVAAVLELVGMYEAKDRRVRNYSKGMLQRIGLAQALIHNPRLLILDEATAGVDPAGAAMICELILRLRSLGKTILLTSHLLAQIEEICDTVGILDHGRLVFTGSVATLRDEGRQSLVVDSLSATDLGELERWLAARGRRIHAVTAPRSRLEQVYLERIGRRNDL